MYRICEDCGARLDPNEICDCKVKAASGDSDTESGMKKTSNEIINHTGGKVNV